MKRKVVKVVQFWYPTLLKYDWALDCKNCTRIIRWNAGLEYQVYLLGVWVAPMNIEMDENHEIETEGEKTFWERKKTIMVDD